MDGIQDGAVEGSIVGATLGTRLGISVESILGRTVSSKDGSILGRFDVIMMV